MLMRLIFILTGFIFLICSNALATPGVFSRDLSQKEKNYLLRGIDRWVKPVDTLMGIELKNRIREGKIAVIRGNAAAPHLKDAEAYSTPITDRTVLRSDFFSIDRAVGLYAEQCLFFIEKLSNMNPNDTSPETIELKNTRLNRKRAYCSTKETLSKNTPNSIRYTVFQILLISELVHEQIHIRQYNLGQNDSFFLFKLVGTVG